MTATVVTGQQIGILGGPLYTTLKVLGAVRRAEELGGRAVYWLETNDADFEEINHLDFLDKSGMLQHLTWRKETRGLSCGYIRVDQKLIDTLEAFFDALQPTEFTPDLRDLALGAYSEGKALAAASRDLAEALFGSLHLEIFDPQDEKFRRASRGILLNEANRTPEGEQCNLFCIIDQKRVALFKSADGFRDRNGNPVDLTGLDLVPNVKTRNVIQDDYFRTHTYVAGPGEVSYIGELDEMYAYHGVAKARIQPRMTVLLIEPRARRIAEKLGVGFGELENRNREEFVADSIRRQSGFDARDLQDRTRSLTEAYLKELEDLGLDVKEAGRFLRREIKNSLGRRRALEKQRTAGVKERAGLLFDLLRPRGKPQERVFNLFYYMNLYGGRDLIDTLYREYRFVPEPVEVELG
jgi:uncharacterized protein YllA (UPF0747 family)